MYARTLGVDFCINNESQFYFKDGDEADVDCKSVVRCTVDDNVVVEDYPRTLPTDAQLHTTDGTSASTSTGTSAGTSAGNKLVSRLHDLLLSTSPSSRLQEQSKLICISEITDILDPRRLCTPVHTPVLTIRYCGNQEIKFDHRVPIVFGELEGEVLRVGVDKVGMQHTSNCATVDYSKTMLLHFSSEALKAARDCPNRHGVVRVPVIDSSLPQSIATNRSGVRATDWGVECMKSSKNDAQSILESNVNVSVPSAIQPDTDTEDEFADVDMTAVNACDNIPVDSEIVLPAFGEVVLDYSRKCGVFAFVNHYKQPSMFDCQVVRHPNVRWHVVHVDAWPRVVLTSIPGVRIVSGDELLVDFGRQWEEAMEGRLKFAVLNELCNTRLSSMLCAEDTGTVNIPSRASVTAQLRAKLTAQIEKSEDSRLHCELCQQLHSRRSFVTHQQTEEHHTGASDTAHRRMLCCDGCGKLYHLVCLGLPTDFLPADSNDWFCYQCVRLSKRIAAAGSEPPAGCSLPGSCSKIAPCSVALTSSANAVPPQLQRGGGDWPVRSSEGRGISGGVNFQGDALLSKLRACTKCVKDHTRSSHVDRKRSRTASGPTLALALNCRLQRLHLTPDASSQHMSRDAYARCILACIADALNDSELRNLQLQLQCNSYQIHLEEYSAILEQKRLHSNINTAAGINTECINPTTTSSGGGDSGTSSTSGTSGTSGGSATGRGGSSGSGNTVEICDAEVTAKTRRDSSTDDTAAVICPHHHSHQRLLTTEPPCSSGIATAGANGTDRGDEEGLMQGPELSPSDQRLDADSRLHSSTAAGDALQHTTRDDDSTTTTTAAAAGDALQHTTRDDDSTTTAADNSVGTTTASNSGPCYSARRSNPTTDRSAHHACLRCGSTTTASAAAGTTAASAAAVLSAGEVPLLVAKLKETPVSQSFMTRRGMSCVRVWGRVEAFRAESQCYLIRSEDGNTYKVSAARLASLALEDQQAGRTDMSCYIPDTLRSNRDYLNMRGDVQYPPVPTAVLFSTASEYFAPRRYSDVRVCKATERGRSSSGIGKCRMEVERGGRPAEFESCSETGHSDCDVTHTVNRNATVQH
eukprot:Lankesteria_metandrocarpae@DN2253_c0_g1_i2.p1